MRSKILISLSFITVMLGQPTFQTKLLITTTQFGGSTDPDPFPIDLDLDGNIDFVVAEPYYGEVSWFEDTGGGSYQEHVIYSLYGFNISNAYAIDLDLDGDIDIVCLTSSPNQVVWFQNNGSQSFSSSPIKIGSTVGEPRELSINDLDKDGDKEESMKQAAKQAKEKKKKVDESRLLQKENKTLLREQKKMNNKVQLLENKVEKYGTVIEQLKEKLDESNLTNAKLLYQNRILNSISLNERQKDKIVEAISNATTVEEAKIIFETLQSAVGLKSKKTRKQESLNEVVTRSSSAFIPRKEVKPNTDVFSDRMKRLAGLK